MKADRINLVVVLALLLIWTVSPLYSQDIVVTPTAWRLDFGHLSVNDVYLGSGGEMSGRCVIVPHGYPSVELQVSVQPVGGGLTPVPNDYKWIRVTSTQDEIEAIDADVARSAALWQHVRLDLGDETQYYLMTVDWGWGMDPFSSPIEGIEQFYLIVHSGAQRTYQCGLNPALWEMK